MKRNDATATSAVASSASYSGPSCSLLSEGPLALAQVEVPPSRGPLAQEFCPGRHWGEALPAGCAPSAAAIVRADGGHPHRL